MRSYFSERAIAENRTRYVLGISPHPPRPIPLQRPLQGHKTQCLALYQALKLGWKLWSLHIFAPRVLKLRDEYHCEFYKKALVED